MEDKAAAGGGSGEVLGQGFQGDPDQHEAAGDLETMLAEAPEPLAGPGTPQDRGGEERGHTQEEDGGRDERKGQAKLHPEGVGARERGQNQDRIDQAGIKLEERPVRLAGPNYPMDHLPAECSQ